MIFDPSKQQQIDSDIFFELANADILRYRCSRGDITIEQDRDIEGKRTASEGPQTGGIVWETAFFLSMYLTELYSKEGPNRPKPIERILEVGAGCGLLGLVLAQEWGAKVLLTDTPTATTTLVANVAANEDALVSPAEAEAKILRWDVASDRDGLGWTAAAEEEGSGPGENLVADIILGTDVVFTEWLVEPLLETLHALCKAETVVYLCLQPRCQVR